VRLAGETALVTGSTAGIGAAIARRFAAEGATVVVHGRDRERADALAEAIRAEGGTAHTVLGDLATVDPAAIVAQAATAMGGLTVLVNNAVAGTVDDADGPAADLTDAAWEASLRVNLTAPMALIRGAIPHMLDAGHGAIVNISSRQAERASRGLTAYVATKSGLNGLTRAVAVDYAHAGIRCNTVSPGYVVNARRDADLSPERRARLEAMHLTRLGAADDVAWAAVYLASRESEFLTGANLPLDGGGSIARGAVLG
jgi:NAD(P)-dependent dehydrogenase (short-subunit alcohol dehydrogenase family)